MRPIIHKSAEPNRIDDITTSHGKARAFLYAVHHGVPRASLILGHGAGAGIDSPDLQTLAAGLPRFGIEVVLVEQPWHVEGNPIAAHKKILDGAWVEVVAALRRSGVGLRRLVVGGRSAGARVACRTVEHTKPAAVLCTAFPLQPVRKDSPDRGDELAGAAAYAPTTVIQGTDDKYGGPPEIATVVAEHGQRVIAVGVPFLDHSFNLRSSATITDAEARLIVVEAARRAVMRSGGNSGPLLER